jgi:hypothetical protein
MMVRMAEAGPALPDHLARSSFATRSSSTWACSRSLLDLDFVTCRQGFHEADEQLRERLPSAAGLGAGGLPGGRGRPRVRRMEARVLESCRGCAPPGRSAPGRQRACDCQGAAGAPGSVSARAAPTKQSRAGPERARRAGQPDRASRQSDAFRVARVPTSGGSGPRAAPRIVDLESRAPSPRGAGGVAARPGARGGIAKRSTGDQPGSDGMERSRTRMVAPAPAPGVGSAGPASPGAAEVASRRPADRTRQRRASSSAYAPAPRSPRRRGSPG